MTGARGRVKAAVPRPQGLSQPQPRLCPQGPRRLPVAHKGSERPPRHPREKQCVSPFTGETAKGNSSKLTLKTQVYTWAVPDPRLSIIQSSCLRGLEASERPWPVC